MVRLASGCEEGGERAVRTLQGCNCDVSPGSPSPLQPGVECSSRTLVPSFSGSLSRSVVVTHCSEVISKTSLTFCSGVSSLLAATTTKYQSDTSTT